MAIELEQWFKTASPTEREDKPWWEDAKAGYEWLYPEGPQAIPALWGEGLTRAGIGIGEAATWLARTFAPEQKDLPDWLEQDIPRQALTLAQAGSLIALGAMAGYTTATAITGLGRYLAHGKSDRIAEAFARDNFAKIQARDPSRVKTLEDAIRKAQITLRLPTTTKLEATYFPETMSWLGKVEKSLLKPVSGLTGQVKTSLLSQVKVGLSQAGVKLTPEILKPFTETIDHYIGSPVTGEISQEFAKAVVPILNKFIPIMIDQVKQTGTAVIPFERITAEEKIVEEEIAKPLAEAPPGEEVVPKAGPLSRLTEKDFIQPATTSGQGAYVQKELFSMKDKTGQELYDYAKDDGVKLEEIIRAAKDKFRVSELMSKAHSLAEQKLPGKAVSSEYIRIAEKEHYKLLRTEVKTILFPEAKVPPGEMPEEFTLVMRDTKTGEIVKAMEGEVIHTDMMARLGERYKEMEPGWVDPEGKFYDVVSGRRTLVGFQPIPPIPPTPPPSEMPQFAPEPDIDPVVRLTELIKQAKPARKAIEKAYTAERAKRIGEVEKFIEDTIDTVGGEEGYRMILSKLKGELVPPEAKIVFEPIKEKLTQEQLKSLYVRTWKHPYLDNWEKISAADGLTNLLMGEIPQAKKLVLLEEIYGSELVKHILSKRLWGTKAKDLLVEAANVPRALLATADMSAFLRQGIIEIPAHPVLSAKAIGKTFQFAFSPESFQQYFKDLPKDKLYSLMRKSGLAITDPARVGMGGREEPFISRFLQKVPILEIPVTFAERSYVGFLNKLRIDIFKVWADELLSKGMSPVKDIKHFKAAASVVNTFTGRGGLGALDKIGPELNTVFFSPRLISARFNALNPVWYAKQPKEIRKKALGDFAKFVVAGLTTLALIKLSAGDKVSVETDPRSSDFGKIRIGDTRFDIWGGFQQWARVFAQVIMGERKNTATGEIISLNKDEYPFTTRYETILRFSEGKFAPIPQLARELMTGAKTFSGEDMTIENIAEQKLVPMYIQDITDAYRDGGLGKAVGAGIPAFFGVGVQTWKSRKKKPKKAWYEY